MPTGDDFETIADLVAVEFEVETRESEVGRRYLAVETLVIGIPIGGVAGGTVEPVELVHCDKHLVTLQVVQLF